MQRKKCKDCGKRRAAKFFRLVGWMVCRECENVRSRQRRLVEKGKVLEYLRKHPCVDCGEQDPVVLEFDHVRGVKNRSINELMKKGYCWDTIQQEIEKCEVRCANCHRIKTAKQYKWWVYEQEYGRAA